MRSCAGAFPCLPRARAAETLRFDFDPHTLLTVLRVSLCLCVEHEESPVCQPDVHNINSCPLVSPGPPVKPAHQLNYHYPDDSLALEVEVVVDGSIP